jgi:predicted metal-binding membrane protein
MISGSLTRHNQHMRANVIVPTVVLAAAAWAVTVVRMRGMDMGPGTDLGSLSFFAGTWTVMMAAMMLPSALPAVASFADVEPRRRAAAPLLFAASYVAVWAAIGLAAFTAYRWIRAADLGFLAWDRAGAWIAGAAVIAAGLYELTPLKRASLRRCRAGSLTANPVAAGLRYGGNCVGCSAGLMLVLFALGVMSITWMIVVAALVFVEKVPRIGASLSAPIALVLVTAGVWIAVDASSVPGLTSPM